MKTIQTGCVYMITSPTNRIYIGSTINYKKRYAQYKCLACKKQTKLYNSLKKYNIENHLFEIVWVGPIEEMYKYETLIGWGFNVLEKENLNLQLPKLGDKWICISEERILKISKANKGNKHSEKSKKMMSNSHKGKALSEEHRKNISIANIGRKISDENKELLRIHNTGKKHSKETILKVLNSRKSNNSCKKCIIQYDLNMNFIKEWVGAVDASKMLNIQTSSITKCCKGERNKAGGFKWKYKQ